MFATVLSFLVFIGIVAWAYSSRRKQPFEAAARAPFALPDDVVACAADQGRRSFAMSDFTSDFWGLYVAGLTLVSILACGALLYSIGRKRVQAPAQTQAQAQTPTGTGPATTGHVWDGDLAEYNNPLPRWWMWLFYITIAFGLGYLVLYPGLGKLPGVLGWTSAGAARKRGR